MRRLEELERQFESIDQAIVSWDASKRDRLPFYRRELRKLHRAGLQLKLDDDSRARARARLEHLLRDVQIAQDFLNSLQIDEQNQSLRILSNISTVCLPLSLITGFFGMNFAWMGIDPDTRGVYRWRHAQAFVGALSLACVAVVQYMFAHHVV